MNDPIDKPDHYTHYPKEVIDIIHFVLGDEGFAAYCIGNELKYRLRAGDKGEVLEDFCKATRYRMFQKEKL